ncbi:PEP-CTERM protein-sorting domain-containing protein [Parasphingorhabdus marina DSM 22363]|uniref:PEP-CTERM protein-sorting domain-containing protein n=2 Tax=Parasphingorhabdus marina TaxID=394732 RepID=A0A1N6CLU2_9SPHN|nr:PEP-CTERM protein-sorting domain-containing protein [Parasphingorhabdus marina DSM 22363]
MRKFWAAAVSAIAIGSALGGATTASAAIIEYQVSGNGSGTLGGDAFDGAFTITSRADTGSQQPCIFEGMPVAGCALVVNDSVELDIAGLGQFNLTGFNISFVNNNANVFGFSELIGPPPGIVNSFAFVNITGEPSPFSTWDGISNLAAFDTNLTLGNFFAPSVQTNGGELVFTSPPIPGDARFSASIVAAAVPEPATWAMMIAGFGMAGASLRRRKNRIRVSYG